MFWCIRNYGYILTTSLEVLHHYHNVLFNDTFIDGLNDNELEQKTMTSQSDRKSEAEFQVPIVTI